MRSARPLVAKTGEGEGSSHHAKARRRYTSGGDALTLPPPLPNSPRRTTACAIVPLYPNELSSTELPPNAAHTCVYCMTGFSFDSYYHSLRH